MNRLDVKCLIFDEKGAGSLKQMTEDERGWQNEKFLT